MRPFSIRSVSAAVPSARVVALAAVVAMTGAGLSACGGTTTTGATSASTSPAMSGGSVTMALASLPANWNPMTADGASFDADQIADVLFPPVFVDRPDLTVALNTDIMVSAQQTKSSPQTVVYKIRRDASWSDGTPISAADFTWAWHRLSGADQKYLVNGTTGYDRIASVTGSDGGKTVTVVFRKPFADWRELFSSGTPLLPSHYIDSLARDPHAAFNTGLATKPPAVVGGPFRVASYSAGSAVTLDRNPAWHGRAPHLDQLVFREIADPSAVPQAIANGEIDVAYPTPQIDLLRRLRTQSGVGVDVARGMSYEHIDVNLASPTLAALPLRRAILTGINRAAIADATVRQMLPGTPLLGSRLSVPGSTGYADSVSPAHLGSGDVADAHDLLAGAGYRWVSGKLVDPHGTPVPALRYVYLAGNQLRADAAQLVAAQLQPLGITVKPTPVADFGKAIGTGSFDLVQFAWVSSPFPASTSRDIFASDGALNMDHYANKRVDTALDDAMGALDTARVARDLRTADTQLSADAVTLPLYQTPTVLVHSARVQNAVNNPTLGGPTWNILDWAVSSQR